MPLKMKRRYVLGLDVSTSITGVCLIDRDVVPDGTGNHIVHLDHIEFKKCKTLWDKADVVAHYLNGLHVNHANAEIAVAIEEPLLGFRQGMSSATTIASLLRFNGIVSYISRNTFNVEPNYISAPTARKQCGLKLQKPSVAGKSQKEQVFDHMAQHDLSHVKWPTKKNGTSVDWSRDATDAYVIARAACLMNI
jgi:hypothetical protein